MTKYNYDYAKPDADMRPIFAPMPLRIEIPHHEEWDEDIIDPETGEPTGEKEHKEYDWVEYRTVIHPEKPDFLLAGYKRLYDTQPGVHEEGKHWERTGRIADSDTFWRWEYVLVDDPPPPPREFSKLKVVAALTDAGVWSQVKSYIEQSGLYDLYLAAQDFREDNPYFSQGLAALKPVVGWTDEQVEALLSQCVKEGV